MGLRVENISKRVEKGAGFTLVELLVVISIIALLLAMLMPALNKAREQAKAVVCMSNVKQLGTAEMLYVEENGGVLSGATGPGAANNIYSDWAAECSWWYYLNRLVQNKKAWVCPSFATFPQGQSRVTPTPAYPYPIGYSYNIEFGYMPFTLPVGSHYNPSGPYFAGTKPVRAMRVQQPSSKVLLLDCSLAWYSNLKAVGFNLSKGEPAYFAYRIDSYNTEKLNRTWYSGNKQYKSSRHRGGVNCVWVDGHAGWMSVSSLMPPPQWFPVWDSINNRPGSPN